VRSEGFYVNEKFTDTSWDRTSDLPICSTVPPRSPRKTVHPTICSYVYDPSPHKISKVDLQGSLAVYKISFANRPSGLQ